MDEPQMQRPESPENQSGWVNMRRLLEQLETDGEGPVRIKTGFPQMDELLGGGFIPGLIVLGGQPGVGKSTFCLQLAENVAKNGIPVLYFSFEMQERLIAAKSISRRLFQLQSDSRVTAEQLFDGSGKETLSPAQRELVDRVRGEDAFLRVLENLYVRTSPRPVSEIKKLVLEFVEDHPAASKPLVIVDYLQFVPEEKDSRFKTDKEKNDDKVKRFTALAHEDGFTVILISSLNRGSYAGDMQISAFKETGEIEYSADLLLGLQFQNFGRKTNAQREQARDPREVKISVLKNRYGKSGCMVPFAYYAAKDCFLEKKAGSAVQENEQATEVQKPPKKEKKRVMQSCVINNTLVAGKIRKGEFERQDCVVLPQKDGKKEVSVRYELSDRLSSLDCCVADAIYTAAIRRWEDGVPRKDTALSPRELMKALSGNPTPAVTAQKMREFFRSIKHLQEVRFQFDCAEALAAQKLDGLGPGRLQRYDGPFLNIRIEEQPEEGAPRTQKRQELWDTGDGKKVKITFQTGVLPLFLHAYGAAVGQMITVPAKLLNVNDGRRNLSNTAENICLKRLLAQRMEIIRYKAEKQEDIQKLSTISFHERRRLMSELQHGQSGLSKAVLEQKQRRIHETVKQILIYYKRVKYIVDFEERARTEHTKLPSFRVIGPFSDPMGLSY